MRAKNVFISFWQLYLPTTLALVGMVGCMPSPGVIDGALVNTDFAAGSQVQLIVRSQAGDALEERRLDGRLIRVLFKGDYRLVDVDRQGQRFLLRDDNGRLVAAEVDGSKRTLDWEPNDWNFALDARGERIATVSSSSRLISIRSFQTLDILQEAQCPEGASNWIHSDRTDPNVWWLAGESDDFVRLDLASGRSTHVPRAEAMGMRLLPGKDSSRVWWRDNSKIQLTLDARGIYLSDASLQNRQLVRIVGRCNGFLACPMLGIVGPCFVDEFQFVIFEFNDAQWVVDTKSGKVGPLPGKVLCVLQ